MKRKLLAAAAAVMLAVALAACAGDDSEGSAEATTTENNGGEAVDLVSLPESGCGSAAMPLPDDPDGVLAAMPEDVQQQYAPYSHQILESNWADWAPQGDPPYTVGVQWSALNTDFQVEQTEALQEQLDEDPNVGEVIFQTTADSIDVPAQLQQFEALLRESPDIIIAQPIAGEPFEGLVDRAAAEGIPVVVGIQHVDSANAVNVQPNAEQMAVHGASALVRMMGESGNMLIVHAAPGSAAEVDGMAGLEAVLENCPDIEIAGEVTGNFLDSLAKEETLRFLATNPGQLDGVFDVNSMATGAMAAIDQAGRPMPAVFIRSVDQGALGYWLDNLGEFDGFATGISSRGFGAGVADTALRMLRGDGVKLNTILRDVPFVTDENVEEWGEEDWDLHQNFDAAVTGPPEWIPQDYMDLMFHETS